jgi:hypothetical protein
MFGTKSNVEKSLITTFTVSIILSSGIITSRLFPSQAIISQFSGVKQSKCFPVPLGDLDQQWSALRQLNEFDLIYAPSQTQTQLLSYLRGCGLLKVPIVCLAHHPLERGRLARLRKPFTKLSIKGTDAFPLLAKRFQAPLTVCQRMQTSQLRFLGVRMPIIILPVRMSGKVLLPQAGLRGTS